MSIIAVSHRATTNLGDLVCSPCLYFDYGAEHYDIKSPVPDADAYIFGGGAMFRKTSRTAVSGVKVAWGLGQSVRDHTALDPTLALKDFALVGSRDVGQEGAEWVPCASCMSPLFDEEYEVTDGVVAYLNSDPAKTAPPPEIDGLRAMCNRGSFEDAIRFIASGNVCVTNSYHGAYWATLLGRAAVIVSAYSSKFYCFKHQPPVVKSGYWRDAKPQVFHDALDECRDANIAFDMKVRSLLC